MSKPMTLEVLLRMVRGDSEYVESDETLTVEEGVDAIIDLFLSKVPLRNEHKFSTRETDIADINWNACRTATIQAMEEMRNPHDRG